MTVRQVLVLTPALLLCAVALAGPDWQAQRERMVREQIQRPTDGRTHVRDEQVLAAMRAVPRHAFVPDADYRRAAYGDTPLPIGMGQTISQPYIVALMTELLELKPDSKVLEIGTGSGYQAAVLAEITSQVYSVEVLAPLAERAAQTLKTHGYDAVRTKHADGYLGWPEEAPFDRIIVTCAAGHLPPALWDQLRPGGRIVIPLGAPYEVQRLVVITKDNEGRRRSRTVSHVAFVPMTRLEDQRQE
jgi:protein-L-isoaspartate(D-aspartate) O-methyltransferase